MLNSTCYIVHQETEDRKRFANVYLAASYAVEHALSTEEWTVVDDLDIPFDTSEWTNLKEIADVLYPEATFNIRK